jgi:hypothetical protein
MAKFLSGEWITAEWILSIATIALVLVTAGLVLVTAIAFYLQSRQNRFALGIDLLLKLDDQFDTPMMRASRRRASTYLKEKQRIHTGSDVSIDDLEHSLDAVLDFFDQVGYFLKRGALEREQFGTRSIIRCITGILMLKNT